MTMAAGAGAGKKKPDTTASTTKNEPRTLKGCMRSTIHRFKVIARRLLRKWDWTKETREVGASRSQLAIPPHLSHAFGHAPAPAALRWRAGPRHGRSPTSLPCRPRRARARPATARLHHGHAFGRRLRGGRLASDGSDGHDLLARRHHHQRRGGVRRAR